MKPKSVKGVVNNIAEEELPWLVETIMKSDEYDTMRKVHLTGLLDTVIHHIRLVQAELEL